MAAENKALQDKMDREAKALQEKMKEENEKRSMESKALADRLEEVSIALSIYIDAKESNSTANESKRHYNRSIIYYLNIAPIVNDSFWNS